jgi:hypothetical protein
MFNDKDQSLSVASRDGYIGRWSLPQFHVINESIVDELISYNCIDYFHDESAVDINQLVLAGAHKDLAGPPGMDTLKVVKMLNSKDIPIKELYGEGMDAIGKLTQVKYINYNQNLKGVITSNDKGSVQVLNNYNNFLFDEKFEFTAHYGPVT